MPVFGPATYVPEVHAFEPPYWFRNSQTRRWYQATDEMGDDELLWRTYWKRFNTVEIPILPQDEFFETALSIAKLAGGRREEFERIFEERKKEWWKDAKRQVWKAGGHAQCHREAFPCDDAREKMIRVCETGCFTHFLDILKGNAFGYEADVVREEPPDNAPNNLDEEEDIPEDEYFDEDGMPFSQMFNYDPDICFYEEPSTKDWREPLMADNVFYIGSYTVEYAQPDLKDGDERAPDPETGRTSMSPLLSRSAATPERGDKEKTIQTTTQKKRKRKSVRFGDVVDAERHQHQQQPGSDDDNDDDDRAHKRARQDASSHASSLAQPATGEGVSKKRARNDDDDNDRQKRQKLETPTAPVPTPHNPSPSLTAAKERKPRTTTRHSKGYNHRRKRQSSEDPPACPPTPTASSSTTATGSTASRKRSRQDDDDDDDNGFKRQKLEDPAAHTPPSLSSSSAQHTTDQKEDARESRKQRKATTRQSRTRPSAPPKSLNTRSRRRGGPSTFLELDQTGKPRSV